MIGSFQTFFVGAVSALSACLRVCTAEKSSGMSSCFFSVAACQNVTNVYGMMACLCCGLVSLQLLLDLNQFLLCVNWLCITKWIGLGSSRGSRGGVFQLSTWEHRRTYRAFQARQRHEGDPCSQGVSQSWIRLWTQIHHVRSEDDRGMNPEVQRGVEPLHAATHSLRLGIRMKK